MLSQIGCVTVPPDILAKVYAKQTLTEKEQQLFDSNPLVRQDLVSKIPRLRVVAKIIANQKVVTVDNVSKPLKELEADILGGQMLNVSLGLDQFVSGG